MAETTSGAKGRPPAKAKASKGAASTERGRASAVAPASSTRRRFLAEYAIVVIGVLTALAAEQFVQWLHWRYQAQVARAAITRDQQRLLYWIGMTDKAGPCAVRRLEELEGILDQAAGSGRLPPLEPFAQPPRIPWTMRGWEGAVSGGILLHLGAGEAERYAAQAAYLSTMQKTREDEAAHWAVLHTISGPGRQLSSDEAASLRAALGGAWRTAYWLRRGADQIGGMVLDTRLLSRSEMDASWRSGFEAPAPGCDPLRRTPARRREAATLLAPAAPPSRSYEAGIPYGSIPIRK